MYTAASFLLFGACACVALSIPVRKSFSIQKPSNLESQDHFGIQDDALVRIERGRRCTYNGTKYVKGTVLGIPLEPNYDRCDSCRCIRGKFRKCTTRYCDIQCDEFESSPGECCVCKRKSCEFTREAGDQWQQIKNVTGPNEEVLQKCSFCKCGADLKEYCTDHDFQCFEIPGCLETEKKPDFCCPQCKIWASSTTTTTTTQPWFTIKLTKEGTTPSFTFPFDSSEDQEH